MHKLLTELLIIDKQYETKQDKNYYLVHKYNELIKTLNFNDITVLRDLIYTNFDYHNYKSFLLYVSSVDSYQEIMPHINVEKQNSNKDLSILDFYEHFDDVLIAFIKGHLFLENAMNLILNKVNNTIINQTFSNKIDILYKYKRIDHKMKTLLKEINLVRNSIAHNLYYEITFDKMFKLAVLSSKAGVIYSDDTIYENKLLSYEWYNVKGIIFELFPNTFSHLLETNDDIFTIDEITRFIC